MLGESNDQKPDRWRWLRNAFSMDAFRRELTEPEVALLNRLAVRIVRRRMTVPSILFLETVHPLNYIGSQAMAFFEPMVKVVFTADEYTLFRHILERREGVRALIEAIEAAEADSPSGDERGEAIDDNDTVAERDED